MKFEECSWLSSRYLTLDDIPQILHRSQDSFKNPYRIISIFCMYMYIGIGEGIAGKQDGPSLIIEGPPRVSRIAKNANVLTLWPIYEKLVVIFALVIHMSAR